MPKTSQQALVVSVKEARKILGREHKNLTDEQLEKLIVELSAIAKLYIRSVPKY